MLTSSAKSKARLLQKWVRLRILNSFKTLTERDVYSRSMGANGTDIILSEKASKLFSYSVECKSLAKSSIYKFYEQAESNREVNMRPLVILKNNTKKPLAIVDAEHFIELVAAYRKLTVNDKND